MTYAITISEEKPPIWENARAVFRINLDTVIFSYGDTIYNPGKVEIPPDIMIHEMVHIGQQKGNREDAALWWGKYMRDAEFRLSQEVEAYGKQYWYICTKKSQDKRVQWNVLKRFAEILSGPLYAGCVGLPRAIQLIKEEARKHEPSIH